MSCKETRQKISAYIDNELDAAAAARLTRHIEQCQSCRNHLHNLQNVDILLRELPAIDAQPGFVEQIIARAGEWDTPARKELPNRTVLSAIVQLFEGLFDLLERNKTPNTGTLDELGDFPPLSMSYVYFKILGQP
jgi:hypothetical protein